MEANDLHNDPLHTRIMASKLELLYRLDSAPCPVDLSIHKIVPNFSKSELEIPIFELEPLLRARAHLSWPDA